MWRPSQLYDCIILYSQINSCLRSNRLFHPVCSSAHWFTFAPDSSSSHASCIVRTLLLLRIRGCRNRAREYILPDCSIDTILQWNTEPRAKSLLTLLNCGWLEVLYIQYHMVITQKKNFEQIFLLSEIHHVSNRIKYPCICRNVCIFQPITNKSRS